jgi:cobalt-zinc-cadmium efflux system membrane fusion protein
MNMRQWHASARNLPWRKITAALVILAGGYTGVSAVWQYTHTASASVPEPMLRDPNRFYPSAAQWSSFTVEPVTPQSFRDELVTEGKIAVDEDRSTAIFAPYTGRVAKLAAAPGEHVEKGQPLFVLEASDTVQAQNEFINAAAAVDKARAQVNLAETVERRQHNLYDAQAGALRDWQQAQADLTNARNDLRGAQTTLEAMRNRLRLIGRSDAEIDKFQKSGAITPETTVFSPLSGTVVQRKVGPGQYVSAGATDPVYVIGDLSTVWLVAYVRETDAMKIKRGQDIKFTVLAQPGKTFRAKIDYVAAAIDPVSRRRMVRAAIPNTDNLLAPEMFATVTIVVGEDKGAMAAVPRGAVIYEGNTARLWVVHDDQSVELRSVKTGMSDGDLVQVVEGLGLNEKVITRGSLFIDRLAARSQS